MVIGLTLSCRKIFNMGKGPRIQWIRTYGGVKDDKGYSVQQTRDGGYIIIGSTESFGARISDVYMIKTDKKGRALWTKTYGGSGFDEGFSIKQTRDGGYIITGELKKHMCLIKTDSLGEIQWQNEDIRSYGYCVHQTRDNGYIVKAERILIKTNTDGNIMWTKKYEGYFVRETSEGGYIITGHYPYFLAGVPDIYITKTNKNGDVIWEKIYGGKHGDTGYSVQETKDGGYIVLCQTATSDSWEDVCLLKVDKNGDSLWAKVYGGKRGDEGYSFTEASNGGYIIAGYIGSYGAGEDDVYLIRTDEDGDTLWTFVYGGESSDGAFSIDNTSDGGYIIAGYTKSFGEGKSDVLLIKLKPEK